MIEIKPNIQHQSTCPYTGKPLKPETIILQGMHVCVKSKVAGGDTEIVEDLRVGHAVTSPYQIDLAKGSVFGNERAKHWLGKPLLQSLQNPRTEDIKVSKEVFKQCKRIIILNCIDYVYGHSLLKLLNAQRHLENNSDYGLVVIVQKFLRWMVPEGVAEIWTVDLSLKNGQCYYPSLERFLREELQRFEEVYVSKAHSHPSEFDITKFTRVPKHSFQQEEVKITFVWRQDRVWCNPLLYRILKKINLTEIALLIQNRKVQKLFKSIKRKVPSAKFAIAALGTKTRFPEWIEDLRVDRYDEDTERKVCQLYSESRLVIGRHGSNMLLPSAHSGMTIDLMPQAKWSNFAQDILYQETDPRLASFRYRYLPLETSIADLAYVASDMILRYSEFNNSMTADKSS